MSDERLNQAIKAVYAKYGTDLSAFFRDVENAIGRADEAERGACPNCAAKDAEIERLQQKLADVLQLSGGDVDSDALACLEELREKAGRAEAAEARVRDLESDVERRRMELEKANSAKVRLQARVKALEGALNDVLSHLPESVITDTFLDDDPVYRTWYVKACAALAEGKERP